MDGVPQTEPLEQTSQRHTLALGLGLALTLLVVLALRLQVLRLGVPGQWEWPYREPALPLGGGAVFALLVSLAAAALVGRLLREHRPLRRSRVALGLVAVTLACACGLAGLLLERPLAPAEVPAVSVSVTAMGYYSYALAAPDLPRAFAYFSGRPPAELGLPMAPGRVATHPPGPFLYFALGRAVLQAWPAPVQWLEGFLESRWGVTPELLHSVARHSMMPNVRPEDMVPAGLLALVVTFVAALLPLPAYLLGRELTGPREGLVAALLAATIPSLLVFTPSIDGVAALLAVTAMALAVRALRRGRPGDCLAAGLALAAAVFWTAGTGALAVAIAVTAALYRRPRAGGSSLAPLPSALLILGTTALVFVLLRLTLQYDVVGNLRAISGHQRDEMTGRSYLAWLPLDLCDFALFMGPLLAVVTAAGARLCRRLPLVREYLLGFAVMLALLLLSGGTRGEVGRIWLFLMPLPGVAAAALLCTLPRREAPLAVVLASLCQFGTAYTLSACLALVQP